MRDESGSNSDWVIDNEYSRSSSHINNDGEHVDGGRVNSGVKDIHAVANITMSKSR